MGPRQFFARIVVIILSVVTFHILGIEILVFFIMAPTWAECVTILTSPLPVAIPLVASYIIIAYYYVRPIRDFLAVLEKGTTPAPQLIRTAESRCINLPYFLSGLSFPAYILGGIFGVGMMVRALPHWPPQIMFFGFLGGIIAGLLTIPMAEHFTAWAIRPVLEIIMAGETGLEKSRTAGFRMPLRRKFVLIVVVMVVGITGYSAIISYNLIHSAIDNMSRIEELVPAAQARQLASNSLGSGDKRIKSAVYFQSRMRSITLFFIGFMIVATLLALSVSLAATNAITHPLNVFERVTEKIRNGVYDESINLITNDEFSQLGASFNRMTETLFAQLQQNQVLITGIRDAVQTLSPMSRNLVNFADQQAAGSVQQAAATEEAAATGRQIAEGARHIAENAARITRNSEITREVTQEGQQRLQETETTLEDITARMKNIMAAITRLKQQSQEIDAIVETIKKISGKTNILSLNAGIEAVKAGESGLQFGVVAREIRLLAKDSSQSAKKIQSNIESIQQALATSIAYAEEGEQAVSKGRRVMTQMTEQFEKILRANLNAARDLEEIETMTSRQAESNQQLSSIITQIKKGTEETATAAEKTHNTLKSLEELVTQLRAHTAQTA